MVMESSRISSSSSSFQTLAAVLLAERQHQHGGALGPRNLSSLRAAACWRPASVASVRGDVVLGLGGHAVSTMSCSRFRLVQPVTDDRDGFVRIAVGQFAHLLHRLGVHLALDLGDVDHASGSRSRPGIGARPRVPPPGAAPPGRGAGDGQCGRRCRPISGDEHAPHQRAHHQNRTTRPRKRHHAELDAAHDVLLGELQHQSQPVGSATGSSTGASANRRLTTSTWSPRFSSKPIAERTSAAMRSSSSFARG